MGKKKEGTRCNSCGSIIPPKRVEAIKHLSLNPLCLECQEAQEMGEKRKREKACCKRAGRRGKPRGPFNQMHDCLR